MPSIEARATWRGGYATDVRARDHEVRVDEPAGTDTGMMPTELFCASLATCFCLAVAHVAGKRGIDTPGLEVTVRADRSGSELRYERLVVTASAAMDAEQLDALVRRAIPFCWVSNTLAAGVDVEYRSTVMNADFRKQMLENRDELAGVLERPKLLGEVFARHAYGMREWVDLFSMRVPEVADPDAKALLAQIVADNARHMLLFRQRARAHGVDPDPYRPPAEGDAIYERIPELRGLPALAGYAVGSLEHFRQLLDVYRAAAEDQQDAAVLDQVVADTERSLAALRPLAGDGGDAAVAEAHELYRRREHVETPRYARAA